MGSAEVCKPPSSGRSCQPSCPVSQQGLPTGKLGSGRGGGGQQGWADVLGWVVIRGCCSELQEEDRPVSCNYKALKSIGSAPRLPSSWPLRWGRDGPAAPRLGCGALGTGTKLCRAFRAPLASKPFSHRLTAKLLETPCLQQKDAEAMIQVRGGGEYPLLGQDQELCAAPGLFLQPCCSGSVLCEPSLNLPGNPPFMECSSRLTTANFQGAGSSLR